MMKKINGFLVFVNITLVVLTLGAYFAPHFHPRDSVFFSLIGLVFPALIFGNIAFILYWLLFNIRYCWGSILVLLVGIPSVINIINIQKASDGDVATKILKIASYNTQFAIPVRSNQGRNKEVTASNFQKHLKQFQHLDIICIQEHSPYVENQISQALQLPYQYFSRGKFVAIYSKYPIINEGQIENFSSNDANACIWADIQVDNKKIRIYAAHFEANRKDGIVPNTVAAHSDEPPIDFSIAVGLLRFYQKFSARRADQAKKLRQLMATSPYPAILCGDINDTPQTHVYQILKEDHKDTFREKGLGIGATFGSTLKNKLALLRIDYIFTPPSFEVLNHRIFPAPFSDHYLIYSKVQLP